MITCRHALIPALLCVALSAATAQAAQDVIDPDRPDVTTGSHLVNSDVVQFEFGVVHTRQSEDHYVSGSPITLRIGVRDWLEARAGFDGLLVAADGQARVTGLGNVQLGAKIRVWPEADGRSRLSVNPQITLGTASAEKGLGSGQSDVAIAALFGFDLGRRGRLDMNYGIASLGGGDGEARVLQHLASASASVSVGERWSPYFELFGGSSDSPDGLATIAINTGALYALKPRLALDGGVAFGLSSEAPAFAAFGGVSIALGGLHSRPPQANAPIVRRAESPALWRWSPW